MRPPWPVASLAALYAYVSPALAIKAGSFAGAGNTQVSAMMMFVGNAQKVYIMDKVEGNSARINGHPAWGSVWDMESHKTDLMDIKTNVFCASGMHLPNGSFVTFGGNSAIGPGGAIGSEANQFGGADYDQTYQDYDGTKAIRLLDPCTDTSCEWFDDPDVLSMQKRRWYAAAEPLADGRIAIIGGFVNGGYINRNYPNRDPEFESGAAESTYEFFPPDGQEAERMQFMVDTSGLNSYAHTYLTKSGKMLIQANVSTMIWDPSTNEEDRLDDMPGGVARVYPASGAVAMLPLTPANNYNPTVLFCGGSDMPEEAWGNYSWPFIDTWLYPASKDCQRITPEPEDGSRAVYEQDDDMIEGRTMGQFIILPDGKLLVLNGAANGTAGYSTQTLTTPSYSDMPFGMSLAAGPTTRPAIYDPNAPRGSRWSDAGFDESQIARLYHSSAILLPDASVLIGGSNPNVDVNLTTAFPTTYQAELFYPSYFSASVRPKPTGIPKTLTYGGNSFDISIPSSSYAGSANGAADNTTVVIIRPGFSTHAMNMGQRYLQLNNTYTVQNDGSITLHVAQAPPFPTIFQPGPAFLYVCVNGVPSVGQYVIVGNGVIGTQPVSDVGVLPETVRQANVQGSASEEQTKASGSSGDDGGSGVKTGTLIGAIAGGVGVVAILGVVFGICFARRRRRKATKVPSAAYTLHETPRSPDVRAGKMEMHGRDSDTSAFVPLQQGNPSRSWNSSTTSLPGSHGMYKDYDLGTPRMPYGAEMQPQASDSGVNQHYASSTGHLNPYSDSGEERR
ncbi:DUF1929-domain-containing protein [Pterulicium gracile]|uniref:DUF1929-domain-containing protein n=1 Tax=Pterulicium gracile TaxID=1884261 RepID=A0A5C3QNA4_9AGAR|nr:DUF1929-domain-containing protein [Pterula gracilis]